MNSKRLTRVFGALLVALGIIFIISPKGVFESIVLLGGIIVIACSIFGIVLSFFGKENSSSYFIGTSILGLIFGIVLISNTDSAIKVIPVFLGIWLFISGISTILLMSKTGSSSVSMTTPITRTILGLICFIAPVVPISIAGIFIGLVLVLSGVNTIANVKNDEIIYKVRVKK